jgi:anthranilate synthase/aminodeoxychorismate synthase-like glutamine amidotransferase
MILLIDNRDSFVHNLARYMERLGQVTRVLRSDTMDVSDVRSLAPAAIIISPGPCTPRKAGASLEIVRALHQNLPILGVCLGHQVIAEALGGRIVRARRPVHGESSEICHVGEGIFANVPSPFRAGRYHSLVVEPSSLPASLRPTAWSANDELMAFEHERLPVYGVQFHPESILTDHGYELLANFLRLAAIKVDQDGHSLATSEITYVAASSVE